MIYAIGLESEFFNRPGRMQRTRPDRGLRKLAEETGGGYFELKKTDDLGADVHARRPGAAQPVHARLHTDVLDGKEHKLDVKMKQAGHDRAARARATSRPPTGSVGASDDTDRAGLPAAKPIARSSGCSTHCCRSPTSRASRWSCRTACCRSSSRIRRRRNSSSARTRRSGRSGCRRCRAATSWRGSLRLRVRAGRRDARGARQAPRAAVPFARRVRL